MSSIIRLNPKRYHIRRENMLLALDLPARIPLGQSQEWENVVVVTGFWNPRWGRDHPSFHDSGRLVLPRVRLQPRGVANRIQVLCPVCRSKWVRFGCLQQHAGTVGCLEAAAEYYASQEHVGANLSALPGLPGVGPVPGQASAVEAGDRIPAVAECTGRG